MRAFPETARRALARRSRGREGKSIPEYRRGRATTAAGLLLALSTALGGTRVAAGRGDALPYSLLLRVSYGEPAGPAALLEELEFEIVQALGSARCFEAVVLPETEAASGAGLALDVLVEQFGEETLYDLGIAAHQGAGLPTESRNAARATVGADLTLRLRSLPGIALIRSRRWRETASYRPPLGEDAGVEARRKFLQNAARSVTAFGCKGSAKSLARAIDRAQRQSAGER